VRVERGGETGRVPAAENDVRALQAELERERRFGHRVTDATSSLLVLVDGDGRIVEGGVNVAMEELTGRLEEELVGSRLDGADPVAWAAAGAGESFELLYVTPSGEQRIVEWTARPLADEEHDDRRYLLCGTDVTEWRRQQELLRESRARIVHAADDERRRLERNLHDGAQQRLVSLLLMLRLIERRLAEDDELASQVAAARAELVAALEELRELAQGLHPAVLTTHGLGPALEAIAGRTPLPVEVDVALDARPSAGAESAAYYVVAESITNAQKHAHASAVRVDVRQSGRVIEVQVADDGVGGADASRGSGLIGLADRVEALGGTLDVTSTPAGTRIAARIPADG
jgi:signal transduction histidine kinase